MYRCFKRQTDEIVHKKTWTWLRKGNLLRETESLLIAAQNNTIRTIYIKAEIDNKQQISFGRLCGEKDGNQMKNRDRIDQSIVKIS